MPAPSAWVSSRSPPAVCARPRSSFPAAWLLSRRGRARHRLPYGRNPARYSAVCPPSSLHAICPGPSAPLAVFVLVVSSTPPFAGGDVPCIADDAEPSGGEAAGASRSWFRSGAICGVFISGCPLGDRLTLPEPSCATGKTPPAASGAQGCENFSFLLRPSENFSRPFRLRYGATLALPLRQGGLSRVTRAPGREEGPETERTPS